MSKPARRHTRKLTLESLETRTLMTASPLGYPSAAVDSGGNLKIQGDAGVNYIRVLEVESGHWQVSAELGFLNGVENGTYDAKGVTGNIAVSLGEGDDRLEIDCLPTRPAPSQAIVHGNLTVRGGAGSDIINVKHTTIRGVLDIDAGRVSLEEVALDTIRCHDVKVRMAGSANHFDAISSQIGKLDLNIGHANEGHVGNSFVKFQSTRVAAIDAHFGGLGTDQVDLIDGSRVDSGVFDAGNPGYSDHFIVSPNSRLGRGVKVHGFYNG